MAAFLTARHSTHAVGCKNSRAVAVTLIFFAFAMQCMSTVAVVRRETGGWKWPLGQWGYMTGPAYVGALIAYQALLP